MGIYTELSEVPDRYRFYQYEQSYAGRDVWSEFVRVQREENDATDTFIEVAEKSGRYWKEHMDDRGRHHSLATPEDVEQWCAHLLEGRKINTVYGEYWVRLEQFYKWLQHHTEHPHVYNPVYMAAAQYPATGRVWDHKINWWQESETA